MCIKEIELHQIEDGEGEGVALVFEQDIADLFKRSSDAENAVQSVLHLLGNVDHSVGNGPNAAKLRGQLLNNIRSILKEHTGEKE